MVQLNEVLNNVKVRPASYSRRPYPAAWTMPAALQVVEAIGQRIDPRFTIDAGNRGFYENLIYWVMADPRFKAINPATGRIIPGRVSRGLYIAGPTGSGKTTAIKILHALCRYDTLGLRLYNVEGDAVLSWYERRADEITHAYQQEGPAGISRAKAEAVVVIDDLGAEPSEVGYMGTRINVCRQLLETRAEGYGLTIITSNLPIGSADIMQRYGERVFSRLCELCNYVTLDGIDRRLNIA